MKKLGAMALAAGLALAPAATANSGQETPSRERITSLCSMLSHRTAGAVTQLYQENLRDLDNAAQFINAAAPRFRPLVSDESVKLLASAVLKVAMEQCPEIFMRQTCEEKGQDAAHGYDTALLQSGGKHNFADKAPEQMAATAEQRCLTQYGLTH